MAPLNSILLANLLIEHSVPVSKAVMKTVKLTDSKIEPWRTHYCPVASQMLAHLLQFSDPYSLADQDYKILEVGKDH